MTVSDENNAVCTPREALLETKLDGLRVALAAARGTVLDLRSHIADLRAAQDFLRLSRETALTEAHQLRQNIAAAEAELERRKAAWLTERTNLLRECDAQMARKLEAITLQVGAVAAERDASAQRVKTLDRLIRELRWENGPRSVRAVLPLARLVRRMSGG